MHNALLSDNLLTNRPTVLVRLTVDARSTVKESPLHKLLSER